MPELVEDKVKRFIKKYNVDKDTAKDLIDNVQRFEELVKKFSNIKPKFIAHCTTSAIKEIKKRHNKELNFEPHIDFVLEKLNNGIITKEAVFEIQVDLANGKKIDFSKYEIMTDKDLEIKIKKILQENKNIPPNAKIGKVMGKLRGKASGKKIVDIIKKLS